MKKVIIIVSILSLVVSLSAFAADKKMVGFSQTDNDNPWRLAQTESVKSEAAKRGYELKYADGQAVQANQIKAVRSFIAQGVDGILLAPKTTSGWGPVLEEAKEAEIPIVLLDRNVDSDPDLVVTFIGSDFILEGEQVAEQMIKDLGEGPYNVAELQGQPGADPTILRAEGFRNVVSKYPEIKIILSQTGEFNRVQGKQVMEAFLKAEGENIKAVYAHNDDMAIGAIQAIEEFGLVPAKDIWIGSIDAVRDAFVAMRDKKLNVSVECTPLFGPSGFDALEKAWAGEELPDWIINVDETFTMDQVDQAVLDGRKY